MAKIVRRPKRAKSGSGTLNYNSKGVLISRTYKNGASTTTYRSDGSSVYTVNHGDGTSSVSVSKPPKTRRYRKPKKGDMAKEINGLVILAVCAIIWFFYKSIAE